MNVRNKAMPFVWVITGMVPVEQEPATPDAAPGRPRNRKGVEPLACAAARGTRFGEIKVQTVLAGGGPTTTVAPA